MALVSSRLAAANAIVALLQAIQNPTTNQPFYQLAQLGAVFNPGASTYWAEVLHQQGQGGPGASGGSEVGWLIDETVRYQVTSGVGPYETNDSTAQANMLALQDTVLPAIRRHFLLPNASNPTNAIQSVYDIRVSQADRSQVAKFPNGHVYLLWHISVDVRQQYTVSLVEP